MASSSTYVVERQRRVAAPPEAVVERLVDFRRWQAWSPWEDVDPDLQRRYSGPESGVGATYEWEGNRKAGKGRMEVVDVSPDGTVSIDLQFLKPFKSRTAAVFVVRPDGDGSLVTWTMTGPKTFVTKVMGIFKPMDKMIGPDFERGLDRLAADAESS
jgi:hypothetical protein